MIRDMPQVPFCCPKWKGIFFGVAIVFVEDGLFYIRGTTKQSENTFVFVFSDFLSLSKILRGGEWCMFMEIEHTCIHEHIIFLKAFTLALSILIRLPPFYVYTN